MRSKRLLVQASTIALIACAATKAHAADDRNTGIDTTIAVDAIEAQQQTKAKPAPTRPAQTKPADETKPTLPATPPATAETGADIVVRGVRTSLAKARETKRASDSIVDVVEAEEVGKLPNNTVGDVIASIPGIAVYRTEGEVNDIQLRGLGGVQTTLGGTPIESGADRVASIADLPADLVKSVEVYKTRSPDQVEGSGAGTINIELRKPNDFREGFFFSGNIAARYNNQSRRVNQTYTGVVNYRTQTGIGDIGAQFGVTVNFNPFLESQARNNPLATVQQRQVVGPNILPIPTVAPVESAFLYVTGSRTTPTYNGSLQWSPDDRGTFTLEGTYAAPHFDRFGNELYIPALIQAASTNALPALSNIVLIPGTNRIRSLTVNPVTQVGPISNVTESKDSNFLVKLSGNHRGELVETYVEITYNGASRNYEGTTFRNRFVNRPTIDIDFASDRTRFPQMNAVFRDVDLLDPNQYRFFGVFENRDVSSNRTLAGRLDFKIRPDNGGFARRIDFGLRFSRRTAERQYGQREIRDLQIPISQMPQGFQTITPIAKGFEGTGVENNAQWLAYDRFQVRANYDKLREFVSQFPAGAAFSTPEPILDPASNFNGTERALSAYGTLNYGVNFLFPIKGIIGARVTNDVRQSLSFSQRRVRTVTTNASGQIVTTFPTVLLQNEGKGNIVAFEPTVTAIVQFTPKFQGRLSYNVGIRRPSIGQVTSFITLNDENLSGSGGNPDLTPEKTVRWDGMLEYYFGRIGIITVNPFYWKIKNSITNVTFQEGVDEGGEGLLYNISRPYNTGNGYRRGVETQAQMFFTFLPGFLKNFGAIANYTYVESKLEYSRLANSLTGVPATLPIVRLPKHVYNLTGLYEQGTFNVRVSYNYNGTVLDSVNGGFVRGSTYVAPRDWMDAAVNYTITKGAFKNLGFSIQMQNVLASARRSFYGYPDLPRDVIYMARTYGGTVRYKF